MRAGGRALVWSFDARQQLHAASVKSEWERILVGIGLSPRPLDGEGVDACATCFSRCTLNLKPGDARTCDAVMSINDEMLTRLGGRMVISERLTDPGATQCVVRVVERARVFPGERETWCDDASAEAQFDRAAGFYDFLMGYFEMPANARALRKLESKEYSQVIELGVGTGLSLAALLSRLPASARVVAVDRSRRMIDRARHRIEQRGVADRVEFVRTDATDTGLASNAFDAVFSSFLLDQFDVEKRRATLREAWRLLKPGGVGCFVVMDAAPRRRFDRALAAGYNALYARWNPIWMALFDGYAPHCRPVRLRELLDEVGFTVTRREQARVTCFPVAIYGVLRT